MPLAGYGGAGVPEVDPNVILVPAVGGPWAGAHLPILKNSMVLQEGFPIVLSWWSTELSKGIFVSMPACVYHMHASGGHFVEWVLFYSEPSSDLFRETGQIN